MSDHVQGRSEDVRIVAQHLFARLTFNKDKLGSSRKNIDIFTLYSEDKTDTFTGVET